MPLSQSNPRKGWHSCTAAALLLIAGITPSPFGGTTLFVNRAFAAAQEPPSDAFSVGERFVIRQRDGRYYYATVERLYPEHGFNMLRYRWSAGHAQGGGAITLAEQKKQLFTLEQARERGFKMANALPAREPTPTPSNPAAKTNSSSANAPATNATAPKANTQDGLTQAEQTELLTAHNRWRRMVGIPDVSWSSSLAQSAQTWAGHIGQTRQCSIDASAHSDDPDFAENLAWRSAMRYTNGRTEVQPTTPTDITNDWAGEKKNYDHAGNTCQGVCGHYTQIVWKSTREIGCGHAVCSNLSQVWVCRYAPPGNYIGQKPY